MASMDTATKGKYKEEVRESLHVTPVPSVLSSTQFYQNINVFLFNFNMLMPLSNYIVSYAFVLVVRFYHHHHNECDYNIKGAYLGKGTYWHLITSCWL